METLRILAACHALTYVDDVLVGDPMEKALLHSVDWTFTKGIQKLSTEISIYLFFIIYL